MGVVIENLAWDKMAGLIPAIVQDQASKQILMLGYMNEAALLQTLHSQKVTFFSRSKNRLWTKGETSGNYLQLCEILPDCDNDSLLITAKPLGPVCHQGSQTCFNSGLPILEQLEQIIIQRQTERPEGSYVAALFAQGIARMAQKVGEEGVEVALAAMQNNPHALSEESADLLFHMLVLLQAQGLSFNAVVQVLQKRMLAIKK